MIKKRTTARVKSNPKEDIGRGRICVVQMYTEAKRKAVRYLRQCRQAEKERGNNILGKAKFKSARKGEMVKVKKGFFSLATYIAIMSPLRAVATMSGAFLFFEDVGCPWPDWKL